MNKVLTIKNLKISFNMPNGKLEAVRGVSLCIDKGEVLALVGESGCGKSVMARSILKLDEIQAIDVFADEIVLDGKNILEASEKQMVDIRGSLAGMVFQDPMTYLNPTMKVGKQITEALLRKGKKTSAECKTEAIRLLDLVEISEPEMRVEQYPHEYSGGMRQRAMIAMALACEPKLLIADEPTTALDPTVQLQILILLKEIKERLGTAMLIITHDFSVVANIADRVAVMYAGKIVEENKMEAIFKNPKHPYTEGLLNSLPSLDDKNELQGIKASPLNLSFLQKGCAFAMRCEECMEICLFEEPPIIQLQPHHKVACWLFHSDYPKGECL